jgi:hypothetical protein
MNAMSDLRSEENYRNSPVINFVYEFRFLIEFLEILG